MIDRGFVAKKSWRYVIPNLIGNLNAFERSGKAVIARWLFQPTACPVIRGSNLFCNIPPRNDGFYLGLSMVAEHSAVEKSISGALLV